jgi:hypothetical protein
LKFLKIASVGYALAQDFLESMFFVDFLGKKLHAEQLFGPGFSAENTFADFRAPVHHAGATF